MTESKEEEREIVMKYRRFRVDAGADRSKVYSDMAT